MDRYVDLRSESVALVVHSTDSIFCCHQIA